MCIKSVLKTCVLLSALSLSQNTLAGSYWAVGGGTTTWDIKPLYGSYEVKDGFTLDLLGGVRNGNFAFEGEFSFSSHDWVELSSATHNESNLILAGLGFLPVGENFELYGKAGMDLWSTTVDYGGYNYEGDNGVGVVLGAGVNLKVSEAFSLRAEYKMVSGLGDGLDKGDITQATLLAVFNY